MDEIGSDFGHSPKLWLSKNMAIILYGVLMITAFIGRPLMAFLR